MKIESTRGAIVAVLATVASGLLVGCIAQASESDLNRDPSLVADEGSTLRPVGRISTESNGQTTKTSTASAVNPSNPNPSPNPGEPAPFRGFPATSGRTPLRRARLPQRRPPRCHSFPTTSRAPSRSGERRPTRPGTGPGGRRFGHEGHSRGAMTG